MGFEVKIEHAYEPQKVLWACFPDEADWSPHAKHYRINGCKIANITLGPRTEPPQKNLLSIFLKDRKDIKKFENGQLCKIEKSC